ncbi:hypothetical protein H2248_002722 [Termitomyces sp. 'cryptogamus']|nr:hypothetical protein H2248_002722 [Termitomyces sp. 'cryptogamus']
MSPDRQRVSSPGTSKPYSRPMTPDASPQRQSVDIALQDISQEAPQTPVIASKPGFPTYEQYKEIETTYLKTLPSSRRDKALISQALFDRIWAVLHSYDVTIESPQFRFWVRKKFTLGKLKKSTDPVDDDFEGTPEPETKPQTVLLHDQNLVAVQEQIYDILCYGHGISNHAGRDKTCSSIREHYTWIPKELVAQFIKACPTCITRKCGMKTGDSSAAKTLRQYLRNLGVPDEPGEEDSGKSRKSAFRLSPKKKRPITRVESSQPLDRLGNNTAPAQVHAPQSVSMSREVSLYKGLPNGWQFRYDDIAEAQKAFISSQKAMLISSPNGRSGRPRVPSIAPMIRAFSEPPLANNGRLPPAGIDVECPSSPTPLTLQPIPGSPWPQKVDPRLPNARTIDSSFPASSTPSSPVKTRPIVPTSITRTAAPSSIDLQTLSSQKSIQAYLTLRDNNIPTPSSENLKPSVPFVSLANSDSSSLYALAVVATESMSSADTALPTPVDKPGMEDTLGKDLAQQKLLTLNMSTEAVCDHGPGVIVL